MLPGAVAVALLNYIVSAAFTEGALWLAGQSPDQWMYKVAMTWPAVLEGVAFPYLGARIAPTHQSLPALYWPVLAFSSRRLDQRGVAAR